MTQVKKKVSSTNRINRGTGNTYVYGSAAPKYDVRRQLEEPKRQLSNETRKNREKARNMSLGYVVFLMGALCMAGMILINYIQLQADVTNTIKHISRLESQLNTAKIANDEEYNRIINNIDLEEIKRIAIGELGMTYAKEGQIITYTNTGNDYMRQVTVEAN